MAKTSTSFAPGNPHRFAPGNPGRRKGTRWRKNVAAAEACRQYTALAVATLVEAVRHAPDFAVRVKAASHLLAYGHGRPPVAISLSQQPLDFTAMSDGELAAAIARLEAYVAAGLPPPVLIEHDDPLRAPAVDGDLS
jgi:hypothetical protein